MQERSKTHLKKRIRKVLPFYGYQGWGFLAVDGEFDAFDVVVHRGEDKQESALVVQRVEAVRRAVGVQAVVATVFQFFGREALGR